MYNQDTDLQIGFWIKKIKFTKKVSDAELYDYQTNRPDLDYRGDCKAHGPDLDCQGKLVILKRRCGGQEL